MGDLEAPVVDVRAVPSSRKSSAQSLPVDVTLVSSQQQRRPSAAQLNPDADCNPRATPRQSAERSESEHDMNGSHPQCDSQPLTSPPEEDEPIVFDAEALDRVDERISSAHQWLKNAAGKWVRTFTSGLKEHTLQLSFERGSLRIQLKAELCAEIATRSRVPVAFELERTVVITPCVEGGGEVVLGIEGLIITPVDGAAEVYARCKQLWEGLPNTQSRGQVAWNWWQNEGHKTQYEHTKVWRVIESIAGLKSAMLAVPRHCEWKQQTAQAIALRVCQTNRDLAERFARSGINFSLLFNASNMGVHGAHPDAICKLFEYDDDDDDNDDCNYYIYYDYDYDYDYGDFYDYYIKHCKSEIIYQAATPVLVEAALQNEKGSFLTSSGALSVRSGAKTGRSPKDKRVVVEPGSVDNVWWGPVNIKMNENAYMTNRERAIDYLNTRERIYVVDGYAGWDPAFRVRVRVICARAPPSSSPLPRHPARACAVTNAPSLACAGAYHALFMKNMLVIPPEEELIDYVPDMIIFNAGGFPANRYVEGMTSSCSVDLHMGRYSKRFDHSWAELVILGTQCASSVPFPPCRPTLTFPSRFLSRRQTGKTTLSADPDRKLIGDDEHVWTDTGVFNVEGGCYAKCIALTEENEPDIYRAIRFGAVVENVVFDDETREIDYDDISLTENTRCAYPLEFIKNAKLPAVGGHPTNVILLTCDGYGVLPPVSQLTREQVIYHFISGYTSKMAGTEEGITKPVAAFSAC
ncbi:MAG: hypothetical protein SGPRY_002369, partial [Prymnesium sp.]